MFYLLLHVQLYCLLLAVWLCSDQLLSAENRKYFVSGHCPVQWSGGLTFVSPQDHPVAVLHDAQHAQLDVGQRHLLPVHLHPHLLEQGDLGAAQPHGDRPQPGEGQGVPGVVGDPDGEGLVGEACRGAVPGEEVLAGALEVEDLPVESFIVRISKDRADSLTGRTEDWRFPLRPAGWTTLAWLGDGLCAWRTGGTGGHTGAALHHPRLAGALTAGLAWRAPGVAVTEGPALVVTDLPGGGLAGGEAGGGEGGGAGAGGAGVRVEAGPGTVQFVPPETSPRVSVRLDLSLPGADRAALAWPRDLEAERTPEDGAGLDAAGQHSSLTATLATRRGRVRPDLTLGQSQTCQATLGVETDRAALARHYHGVVAGQDGVAGLSVLGQHPVMALGQLAGLSTAPPPLSGPQTGPVEPAGAALGTALSRSLGLSETSKHSRAVSPSVLTLGLTSNTGADDAGVEVGDAGHLHGLAVRLVTPVVLPGQLGQG